MPDPRRFHPYYIIEAFSKAQNKIQEHIITREVEKKKRCQDLTEAKTRAIEFAYICNERTMHGTSDWKPLLHLQTEFDGKLLIPLNLD
jgi:hypothetical protein